MLSDTHNQAALKDLLTYQDLQVLLPYFLFILYMFNLFIYFVKNFYFLTQNHWPWINGSRKKSRPLVLNPPISNTVQKWWWFHQIQSSSQRFSNRFATKWLVATNCAYTKIVIVSCNIVSTASQQNQFRMKKLEWF